MTGETFIHETAVIDKPCSIGSGTKIWHFSHVMKDAVLGNDCNLGKNVVISPRVTLGNNVKVQNNVSIYAGVVCEDDVFVKFLRFWFLDLICTPPCCNLEIKSDICFIEAA